MRREILLAGALALGAAGAGLAGCGDSDPEPQRPAAPGGAAPAEDCVRTENQKKGDITTVGLKCAKANTQVWLSFNDKTKTFDISHADLGGKNPPTVDHSGLSTLDDTDSGGFQITGSDGTTPICVFPKQNKSNNTAKFGKCSDVSAAPLTITPIDTPAQPLQAHEYTIVPTLKPAHSAAQYRRRDLRLAA
jgi:hypothetical protein